MPVRSELIAALAELNGRRRGAILRLAERRRAELRSVARALPGGEALVEPSRQRLDRAGDALAARARAALNSRALSLAGLARGLARHSPRAHFAGLRERVRGLIGRLERLAPALIERPRRAADAAGRALTREAATLARRRRERADALIKLDQRMRRAYVERLTSRRARLAAAAQLLDAVSYKGVLARGFALVRDEADRPVRLAAEVGEAQPLRIEFADGTVLAIADGGAAPRPAPPASAAPLTAAPNPAQKAKRVRGPKDAAGQGSLF